MRAGRAAHDRARDRARRRRRASRRWLLRLQQLALRRQQGQGVLLGLHLLALNQQVALLLLQLRGAERPLGGELTLARHLRGTQLQGLLLDLEGGADV
jgi:hypothetical protein